MSAGRGAAATEALQEHRWDLNAFLNQLNVFFFFVCLFLARRALDQTVFFDSVFCNSNKFPRLSAFSSRVPSVSHKKTFSYSKLFNCCASAW